MKILVLHSSSDLYGSGKILLTTVRSLIAQQNTVIVLLSEEGTLSVAMRNAGAEVMIVRLGIIRRKYFTAKGILNRLKTLSGAYRIIKKIVIKREIDLIYSNTTTVLIGAIVAKLNHKKHIWHVHEMIVTPKFMYTLNGLFLKYLGQHIIAVSNPVKQHWLHHVPENNITVIHNGIDTIDFENHKGELRKELGLSEDALLIGMIGRVNTIKGQDYFLEIAALLHEKYPQVNYVLVGDAYQGYEYLYENIHAQIKDKNLQDVVYDLRYREDIPNVINSFDVLVLPSQLPDSFPTVILEAMAAGIPVVATEQGGAIEMIEDDHTGYLIPLRDAAYAAKQLGKLVADENLRIAFGSRGKEKLHQLFSLTVFENKIAAFVKSR